MIRFAENLYTTDSVSSKVSQIKWKTVCGIGMIGVYFITLSLSENDLFDIYSATVFKQRGLRKSNLVILGITASHDEAVLLVSDIINDYISKGYEIALMRQYFEEFINNNI